MSIAYRIGVDWDRDGFVCSEAAPGDPLNLVTTPVTWTDWAITAAGTGGSDVQVAIAAEPFGNQKTTWTSGTSGTGSLSVGGITDAIATCPLSTAHTLIFWIKSSSASWDAISLEVEMRNTSNTLIATSSTFTVPFANGWTKIVFSFTTLGSGSTGVFMRIQKTGSATNAIFDVSGHMIVTGTYTTVTAPEFNAGVAGNLYDNITAWVMNARWNIGARQAYVAVADMGQLSLTLSNTDKIFSPEYSSSPIAGSLVECLVRVELKQSADTVWTLVWAGWTEEVLPTPGRSGPYTALLTATDAFRYFTGKELRLSLLTSARFTDVIDAVVAASDVPLIGNTPPLGVSFGRYQWPYIGDNWDDRTDGIQVLTEAAMAERGFIYINRSGFTPQYWLRVERYDLDLYHPSDDATFDNVHEAMDYRYGDQVVNLVEVERFPRRLSASTTQTVWTLNENIVLAPSTSKTIFAKYNDSGANSNGVNAVGVVPGTIASSTFTSSGGTVNHSETARAQGCEITYSNPSGIATRTVTAHVLTGQRIIAKDSIIDRYEDATSILANGEHSLRLSLKVVAARADQEEIGAIELARNKDPFGRVASVTIGQRDATAEGWIVDLTIKDRIRVIDDQVAHDESYIIIGEAHEVGDGLTGHRTTYYLEKVTVDLITP